MFINAWNSYHYTQAIETVFSIIVVSVNLVHDQGLTGSAAMGAEPQNPKWTAGKAIDGNTNQTYLSNSCAITNVDKDRKRYIWWKVWLQRRFNIAYLEIYFRSDSKTIYRFYCKI